MMIGTKININIAWMVGKNGPEIKYYKVYRLPTIQGLQQQPEKSLQISTKDPI